MPRINTNHTKNSSPLSKQTEVGLSASPSQNNSLFSSLTRWSCSIVQQAVMVVSVWTLLFFRAVAIKTGRDVATRDGNVGCIGGVSGISPESSVDSRGQSISGRDKPGFSFVGWVQSQPGQCHQLVLVFFRQMAVALLGTPTAGSATIAHTGSDFRTVPPNSVVVD